MARYKRGDRVAILTAALDGRIVVEGHATIVRRDPDCIDRYMVRFADGEVCSRFVDPAAQIDPEAFAAVLNRQTGRA